MRQKILTVVAVIIGNLAFSQSFDKAKLDTYFDSLEKNQKLMGSVALAKDGKIFYTKSFGFADVEKSAKNTEHTRFRIGSITKTFTAVLTLKAVEEKKLNLSDKLSKFYPNIKNSEKITLEQMLLHRSGIFSFTNDKNYMEWKDYPKTESEIIDLLATYNPVFEPDTKTEYSNSNYTLLSYILQKVYKKPFSKILEEKIAKPLKLKNTYLGEKINSKKKEAFSYFQNDKGWEKDKETDLSYVLGAGAIVSTTSDLIVFHQGLFGGKLLNSKSLELMKTKKGDFGMGIYQIPFGDKKAYSHNGGIDGFQSVLASFLNENISYARLLNGVNFIANDVDIAVLSAVFGVDYEIPNFQEKKLDNVSTEKYVGTYTSSMMPLKIKVFWQGNQLMAQATGQGAFPLTPSENDSFKFETANIVIEFPEIGKMILKQGGGVFRFEREAIEKEDMPTFTPSEADLKSCVGTYSSKKLPLKIKFFIENGKLMSQADGQDAFELEAVKQHHFRFEPAGIQLEFIPTEKKMKFQQGGMKFEFERE